MAMRRIETSPSTGEWRHCSKYVEKGDRLAHQKSGKHMHTIARVNDPGFLVDFDEQREKITLQCGFKEIYEASVVFARERTCQSEKQGGKP
jgi:hypothetical protein